MDLTSVGTNLKKYRRTKNITQEQLARMTNLTPTYIGMIERGEKTPSLEVFINILNALEVSADKILSNVLNTSYIMRSTILSQQLSSLRPKDRECIQQVLETLISHSAKILK